MVEFIPDPPSKSVFIKKGNILVDLLGSQYIVENVTEDYYDVRCIKSTIIPLWMSTPGIYRYKWTDRIYFIALN